jgi:hypothetical protein
VDLQTLAHLKIDLRQYRKQIASQGEAARNSMLIYTEIQIENQKKHSLISRDKDPHTAVLKNITIFSIKVCRLKFPFENKLKLLTLIMNTHKIYLNQLD